MRMIIFREAFLAAALAVLMTAAPACALDLLATHQVTAQFATPDGKPMANAEVRIFAPDDRRDPVRTGRTGADGKFVFDADRDGMWSAEARTSDQIARIMIRVGGEQKSAASGFAPYLLIGGLAVLAVMAFWYRLLRARNRRLKP
jgi:nickel transport protein